MSGTFVTSRLVFLRSRAMLRLLGAGSEVRRPEQSPRDGAESFSGGDRDPDADRVDAVAGSEFVDDLVREEE